MPYHGPIGVAALESVDAPSKKELPTTPTAPSQQTDNSTPPVADIAVSEEQKTTESVDSM